MKIGEELDLITYSQKANVQDTQNSIKAMRKKIESIDWIQVWWLVYLSKDQKVIGYKLVLKKKLKSDGTLEKYIGS